MNQRLFYTLLILICTFFCFSCHTKQDKEQKEITELADSFATRFYTWHFIEAMNFSDNDMKMHLTFLASNVSGRSQAASRNKYGTQDFCQAGHHKRCRQCYSRHRIA